MHPGIGQAVEMDEHSGSPATSPPAAQPNFPLSQQQNYGLRDSDADVNGMVGLQQDGPVGMYSVESPSEGRPGASRMDSMTRDGSTRSASIYSNEHTYVPPRSHWAQPETLQHTRQYNTSPIAAGAAANTLDQTVSNTSTRHKRANSEPYYEDVDPRFALEEPSDDGFRDSGALPGVLTPGGMQPGAITNLPGGYPATPGAQQGYQHQRMNPDYLHPSYTGGGAGANTNDCHSSDNELSLDARHTSDGSFENHSERASEASHFTSISERPVNPNWRPQPGSVGGGPEPRRQQDVLLAGNPDFSIPGMRGGSRRPGAGPVAASAVGGPSGGLTGAGRYPTEI